jgi:glycine cleavage system H lipoate-binding protein
MDPNAFVSPVAAKAIEYLIAVGYLVLFVPFWRYLDGGRAVRPRERAVARAETGGSWFSVPEGLAFHPGHAWARANGDGLVTVGADEFAFKLVAPTRVALPGLGDEVRQGEPAWLLSAQGHDVAVLSPVSGTVAEINREAVREPEAAARDPYGRGWLMKVRAPRLAADGKQLLKGPIARKWMEAVTDALRAGAGAPAAACLEDGGTPVQGIARALDRERWPEVARAFLLS